MLQTHEGRIAGVSTVSFSVYGDVDEGVSVGRVEY